MVNANFFEQFGCPIILSNLVGQMKKENYHSLQVR